MIRSHTHGGDNGINRILRPSSSESLPSKGEGWQQETLLRLTKVNILVLERLLGGHDDFEQLRRALDADDHRVRVLQSLID